MAVGWKQIDGFWYYFIEEGRLLENAFTPDGYYVNSEVKYIQ